jgi:tRNA dimethylallyltransferase
MWVDVVACWMSARVASGSAERKAAVGACDADHESGAFGCVSRVRPGRLRRVPGWYLQRQLAKRQAAVRCAALLDQRWDRPRLSGVPPIPLVFVLGPTASGKSALALALARQLGGEVVSADAFAVYRGMDIGTAKPSAAERAAVPHHLIDVFEPEAACNGSRWFALADAAVRDIHARGRLPIIAGGTPLYAKLLLERVSAGAPRDDVVRAALQARWEADQLALFRELQRVDPQYAAERHPNDARRVVRALEVYELTGQPYSSFHTTDGIPRTDVRPLLLGLEWERAELYRRIEARAAAMFAAGLVAEVTALAPRLSPEARQAVGYKEVLDLLEGRSTLAEALAKVGQKSRNLAKHQLTWYRGWSDIRWLPGSAPDLVEQALALARVHLRGGALCR